MSINRLLNLVTHSLCTDLCAELCPFDRPCFSGSLFLLRLDPKLDLLLVSPEKALTVSHFLMPDSATSSSSSSSTLADLLGTFSLPINLMRRGDNNLLLLRLKSSHIVSDSSFLASQTSVLPSNSWSNNSFGSASSSWCRQTFW